MADSRYRLRVVPATGEFEIEGSEQFVKEFWGELQPLIDRDRGTHAQESPRHAEASSQEVKAEGEVPETFGEYLSHFGKGLSGTDQILVAGHFQQTKSEGNVFTTGEANGLLMDQGVKLSNPSQSVKNNVDRNNVFKVAGRSFRVSKTGLEHIAALLAGANATG